jgi:transposase InsO family protein
MHNESLNGSKYFLLFIDDFSRYCWVYFLKSKADVFAEFIKFKAAVELETGNKLKILRSDNGGEYTSRQFEAYLAKEGIKHQLTVPYTPQQNGVSERRNRTLMEMARCLLYEKKLPLNFWAEAVNTASYLINRMASRVLADKTPYELWYGFKPSIDHLKVFGSICYVLKPEVRRRKLDQKADIRIFIGYNTTSKAYKIYDLNFNKV